MAVQQTTLKCNAGLAPQKVQACDVEINAFNSLRPCESIIRKHAEQRTVHSAWLSLYAQEIVWLRKNDVIFLDSLLPHYINYPFTFFPRLNLFRVKRGARMPSSLQHSDFCTIQHGHTPATIRHHYAIPSNQRTAGFNKSASPFPFLEHFAGGSSCRSNGMFWARQPVSGCCYASVAQEECPRHR